MRRIERIDLGSEEYPERLRQIRNPPKQLYCMGNVSLLHEVSVAVVGSRKYTVYGKTVALMIGRRLAECNVPVVSGLAIGIDAFSHEGALENNGRVIGVLGSGINNMGPKRNYGLMMRGIEAGGLAVSEYEPEAAGHPGCYPARNRIISGLSSAVIVVEARMSSGSLITARFATEQGRSVYAVPGNINSQFSAGSNLLIRDGAYPLIVIDDVIRDMGVSFEPAQEVTARIDGDEMKVYEAVSRYNGVTVNVLSGECGMTAARISALVTVMEIKGIVRTYAGKIFLAK